MKDNHLDLHLSAAQSEFLSSNFNWETLWFDSSTTTTCRPGYKAQQFFGKHACVEEQVPKTVSCDSERILTTMGCSSMCSKSNEACIRSNSSLSSCEDSDFECQKDSDGCLWQCVNGIYDRATQLNLGRLVDKQHHLMFDQIQGFEIPSNVQSIQLSPPLHSSVKFFQNSWELSENIRNM